MATNVSIDSLMDAMVTKLTASISGARSVQRYMGAEFTTEEGFKRGIAGRTPALRVRHAGTRSLTATIGRRTDRVESTFSIVVCSDSHRSKDDRKSLLSVAESVRNFIGSRAFALMVTPARFRSMETLRDDEQMLSYAVVFTVRHRVDYSVSAGTDTMLEFRGSEVNAAVSHTSIPHAPTVTPQGTPGATSWGYGIVGIDAAGLRTLISPTGTTSTGAATLNGSNFNRVTWAARPGCVSYEVERVTAGGVPATTGKIATTALLTLDDTGLASLGLTPPDSLHVDTHEVFP